jgi:two-component system chemotaxis sensor kinase CheA
VTRLEVIDAASVEWTGGRPLLQYRGKLMPIIPCDEASTVKREGSQSLIVFSDGELTLGLAVEEIVDIVEEHLNIELVADRSDLIGSAVIRGRTTEIVNMAHYLPLVAEAWMRTSTPSNASKTVLLLDGSAFFRDTLAPVLKASHYKVVTAGNVKEALQVLASGTQIDVLVSEIDNQGLDFISRLRTLPPYARLPIIGLTVKLDRQMVELARRLDVLELVAKVDRRGLLTALSEVTNALAQAA